MRGVIRSFWKRLKCRLFHYDRRTIREQTFDDGWIWTCRKCGNIEDEPSQNDLAW